MKLNHDKYRPVSCGFATPCYSYIEGEEQESYWIDSQNCEYYFWDDEDDGIERHWMIEAYIPRDAKEITKEEIKWFVTLGPNEDIDKEWDFNKHKPYEI